MFTPRILLFFTLLWSICHTQAQLHSTSRFLDSSQPNTTVTMTLVNQQNAGYYTTILLGEPALTQFFDVIVDIGTPWIWVPDSACTNCLYSDVNSPYYDCSDNSDTCLQDTSVDQQLSYPNGIVNSHPGQEIVTFTGLPLNISVTSAIYFAVTIFPDFYDTQANGIMGLGLDSHLNNTNAFLNNLYNQGLINNRMFSMIITNDNFEFDEQSTIIFGGYDPQYIQGEGEFQYFPVQPEDGWAIQLTGMNVSNISLPFTTTNAILSILFPYIGVPEGHIDHILSAFKKLGIECIRQGNYTNPVCKGKVEDVVNFPTITINANGIDIVLSPEDYTAYVMSDMYYNAPQESSYCIMLYFTEIQIEDYNRNLAGKWVLGNTFLRNYYVLCDQDNLMIGFAPANTSLFYWDEASTWIVLMIIFTAIFLIVAAAIIGRGLYTRAKIAAQGGEDNERLIDSPVL